MPTHTASSSQAGISNVPWRITAQQKNGTLRAGVAANAPEAARHRSGGTDQRDIGGLVASPRRAPAATIPAMEVKAREQRAAPDSLEERRDEVTAERGWRGAPATPSGGTRG